MSEDNKEFEALDVHFEAARAHAAAPSEALLARVLADAEAVRPVPTAAAPSAKGRGMAGAMRDAIRAIGGWPAAAGLVAATLVGVWIGVSLPAGISAYLAGGDMAYIVDLAPGAGYDLSEGAL